ncbi:hypothetical protein Nepgr_029753 [Nepenthes gracilis]|uniref:Hydroxyproline O-arabinosyltransferase-like domain-containing protein n=1 Tax=Nepenthes gracilis TaxID=150966 RepID=A0AAD3TE88_NEPGR|nr:hypothetical protein Nepgr_029753 [Nepenthes gracilis]
MSGFIKDAQDAADFQNFIVCVEMLIATVGHFYAFPCKEFVAADVGFSYGLTGCLAHALKLNDFYRDTVHQEDYGKGGLVDHVTKMPENLKRPKSGKALLGSDMGGFTRILHSESPDDLMQETPTFVVESLPLSLNRENGPVASIDPIGNSPVIIKKFGGDPNFVVDPLLLGLDQLCIDSRA